MAFLSLLLLSSLSLFSSLTRAGDTYILAAQGQSCYSACLALSMNCNPNIVTNNSTALFASLGVDCSKRPPADNGTWWASDQPSYVSDPADGNYQECLGYIDVPPILACGFSFPTTQRICHCDDPRDPSDPSTFGVGISGGVIPAEEFDVFAWALPKTSSSLIGVMSHFWITAVQDIFTDVIIRYYVDGETVASIQFNPGYAAGVGFNDAQAPWGTQWFGKGAADGAYFLNFRIPFHRSIRVTWQHPSGDVGGCYIIVRGAPNLPISFQGYTLPLTSSLKLSLISQSLSVPPLDYVNIVNLPRGTHGMHFMSTLAVSSGNLNFLEGCYRFFSPPDQPYSASTLLSTGTEDYFDSAWYFNAGQFHLPVSGYTHYQSNSKNVTWSAYRFHEMDPLIFSDGFRLVWRNGDAYDPQTNVKCFIETGGNVVGSPTVSNVVSYAWVYTW